MAKRIELWSVDRLVPYERNARTHSPEQVAQIAASISEFGFVNPILVDSNAGVIAGHGRLDAARDLGLNEVPVVVLEHLTPKQRQAYIIADTKLALNAGWDLDLLNEEMNLLKTADFDLSLLGFSEAEMESIASGGWDSDIEDVEKSGEHLHGLGSKIVIELDGTYKEEVKEAVRMYCDSHAISVEIK